MPGRFNHWLNNNAGFRQFWDRFKSKPTLIFEKSLKLSWFKFLQHSLKHLFLFYFFGPLACDLSMKQYIVGFTRPVTKFRITKEVRALLSKLTGMFFC